MLTGGYRGYSSSKQAKIGIPATRSLHSGEINIRISRIALPDQHGLVICLLLYHILWYYIIIYYGIRVPYIMTQYCHNIWHFYLLKTSSLPVNNPSGCEWHKWRGFRKFRTFKTRQDMWYEDPWRPNECEKTSGFMLYELLIKTYGVVWRRIVYKLFCYIY